MSLTQRTVAVPSRHRLRPWSSAAGRLFVAYWGSLALVDLTRALPGGVAFAALLLLTVVCSHHQPWTAALAVAAVTWLFEVGFVTHAYGALTPVHPRDVVALLVLGVAAVTVARSPRGRGPVAS